MLIYPNPIEANLAYLNPASKKWWVRFSYLIRFTVIVGSQMMESYPIAPIFCASSNVTNVVHFKVGYNIFGYIQRSCDSCSKASITSPKGKKAKAANF